MRGGGGWRLLVMHSSRAGRGRPHRGRTRSRNHGNRRRDALPCHPPAQPANYPLPLARSPALAAFPAPSDYRLSYDDVFLYVYEAMSRSLFPVIVNSTLCNLIENVRTRRPTFIARRKRKRLFTIDRVV